jgi:hypothetical protein
MDEWKLRQRAFSACRKTVPDAVTCSVELALVSDPCCLVSFRMATFAVLRNDRGIPVAAFRVKANGEHIRRVAEDKMPAFQTLLPRRKNEES